MTDERNAVPGPSSRAVAMSTEHKGLITLVVIAVFCVLGFGVLALDTKSKVDAMEQKQTDYQQKIDQRIADMQAQVKSATDAMTAMVGGTQQDLAKNAQAMQKSQRAELRRLTKQQQKQLADVNAQVVGVKTDLDGTKTDVANTKTDLEATKAKLDHTIGDLGVQSGLVATTRDELEILKHKGDRNYYDFTLLKGKSPTPISTVSLQLKKVDPKRNRFTLNVLADDRRIEKKDRNVAEPLQFYTGRDHQLYEVVVFNANKNQVTGYLSTPKEAPQPVSQ